MAKLTVTDRNLLRDEIINRLEKEQTSKQDQLKKIIEEQGLTEIFKTVDSKNKKIKKQKDLLETMEEELTSYIKELFNEYGIYNSYRSYNSLSAMETYLFDKYGKTLPSHREIETALLLAQGGDDMNALMNNVIEQLKNR